MASKIREVLDRADDFLNDHGVDNPRLDAEVLLADLLSTERIKLYVNYDYPLNDEELSAYRSRLKKRARGVPISYITGRTEFMSLEFEIEPGVLIPRPETEELVEKILAFCRQNDWQQLKIVDLGTGSGAMMISLVKYLPESKAIGTDISTEAVKLARRNIKKHDLEKRAAALAGDWAAPLLPERESGVDLVVSNPPYIPEEEMEELPRRVQKEPRRALAAGEDGLSCYRKILPQAVSLLKPEGLLALEIGHDQGERMKEMTAEQEGLGEPELKQDGAGRDRMIFVRRN